MGQAEGEDTPAADAAAAGQQRGERRQAAGDARQPGGHSGAVRSHHPPRDAQAQPAGARARPLHDPHFGVNARVMTCISGTAHFHELYFLAPHISRHVLTGNPNSAFSLKLCLSIEGNFNFVNSRTPALPCSQSVHGRKSEPSCRTGPGHVLSFLHQVYMDIVKKCRVQIFTLGCT